MFRMLKISLIICTESSEQAGAYNYLLTNLH